MCCPIVVGGKSALEEKEATYDTAQIYQASLFINITCYKKNKIFSVNELSNNITSADYR